MDIYCGKCGEPWDMDTFHDVADYRGTTWHSVARSFRARGCSALDASCNANGDMDIAMLASAAMSILGDDMDGVASMMDDYMH